MKALDLLMPRTTAGRVPMAPAVHMPSSQTPHDPAAVLSQELLSLYRRKMWSPKPSSYSPPGASVDSTFTSGPQQSEKAAIPSPQRQVSGTGWGHVAHSPEQGPRAGRLGPDALTLPCELTTWSQEGPAYMHPLLHGDTGF
jgi:hypothetical protein